MRHLAPRPFAALALAALALTACVPRPAVAPPAPAPRFDPLAFFSGHTLGTGMLRKMLSGEERVIVHGIGTLDGDTLVLTQDVEEAGKPAKHRTWRIRSDAPGHYSGTLSDAIGPITGTVNGNGLHLTFTMKGGLPSEQWLMLAPDGRSAHNIMVVRKLGMRVAVLDEDIRKTD